MAMCDLLTEQVKAMETNNLQLRLWMEFEFGYPANQQFKESDLLVCLWEERDHLQSDLEHQRADLEVVQDGKGFKSWFKEQGRANKAMQREAPMMEFDEML